MTATLPMKTLLERAAGPCFVAVTLGVTFMVLVSIYLSN